MPRFSLILLVFLLCACGDDSQKIGVQDKNSGSSHEYRQAAQVRLPAAKAPAEPAPNAAEVEKADNIVAYHNQVQTQIAKGMKADALMTGARIYQATFQLPKAGRGGKHNALSPAKGLFADADYKAITQALQSMDKSLAQMLSHYTSLEKYVADTAIRDDGKKGKELVASIGAEYKQFCKAKNSWLAIVEKAAQDSEGVLLYKHPLKRQIMVAKEIFSQFREVGNLLAAGGPEPELLRACEGNIKRLLEKGGKPPFPAKPAMEREYRSFLKQVKNYVEALDRGITEGFHSVQKRELNAAAAASMAVYNQFARSVNAG